MKICIKPNEVSTYKHPELVTGHIYKAIKGYHLTDCGFYICTSKRQLVNLGDGHFWRSDENSGFASFSQLEWEDVTKQYCLKEI